MELNNKADLTKSLLGSKSKLDPESHKETPDFP